LYTTHGHCYGF